MDATLNIVINAAGQNAVSQINQVDRSLRRLDAAGIAGANGMNKLNNAWKLGNKHLMAWGKNMQWAGRQLVFNFTLPLAIAGGLATKWALENERAMTNVRKVYGDAADGAVKLKDETDALAESFQLLSSRFGIAQKEVIGIGGAWAQAGAEGVAVAKATRLTLEAMIIGEMNQEEAMRGLISIQATYRLSSDQLKNSLADLNAIENETAIKFSDLIRVVQKAGAAARITGVGIQELAAMAATLVPAAGSASEAGSSLKTIFSRLLAPTTATVDVLREVGIAVDETSWLSLTAAERLKVLADEAENLTSNQNALLASTLGSRRQFNRLAQLLDDVRSGTGFYAKSLEAVNDQQETNLRYARELSIYLSSQPQAFSILVENLKNLLAEAILPLLPAFAAFLASITKLVRKFTELDSKTQEQILGWLVAIAVLGPLVQMLGATAVLLGTVSSGLRVLSGSFLWLTGIIVSALKAIGMVILTVGAVMGFGTAATLTFVAAVAAALLFVAMMFNKGFRETFVDGMLDVFELFGMLPQVISDVMVAVIRILAAAMQKVVELLSYLNPFARHSPSLVENVTKGVDEILRQYGRLGGLRNTFASAIRSLLAFNRSVAGAAARADYSEFLENRANIVTAAGPSAGNRADQLFGDMTKLKNQLLPLELMIARQTKEVIKWQKATDKLHESEAALNELLSVQLVGQQAYSDALFENEMAQKALRLELLRMEEAGEIFEDIASKLSELMGELEFLTGRREELRLMGAGQEILDAYDDQIQAVQDAIGALYEQGDAVSEIEDQLAELQLQADIMNLEESITFDPQLRQIEQLVNGVEEMTFAAAMAEATWHQQRVDNLAGVEEALDREEKKLNDLEQAYNTITDSIAEMEAALSQFNSTASASVGVAGGSGAAGSGTPALSPAEKLFQAGEEGDFPIPGGEGILGREGGLKEIEEFNAMLEDELGSALDDISGGGFLEPIEDALESIESAFHSLMAPVRVFQGIWEWMGDWIPRILGWIAGGIAVVSFAPIAALGVALYGVYKAAMFVWQQALKPFFGWLWNQISAYLLPAFNFLWQVIQKVWDIITTGAVWVWQNALQPLFDWVYETIVARIIPIFQLFGAVVEIVVVLIARLIQGLWRHVIKPFWNDLKKALNFLMDTWRAFARVVRRVVGLIGAIVKFVWDRTLGPIFSNIWNRIKQVGEAFKWLWNNVVQPIFSWIGDKFSWLWDKAEPIFSSIKDWMKKHLPTAFRAFRDVVQSVFNKVKDVLAGIWGRIAKGLESVVNGFIRAINAVIRGVRAIAKFLKIKVGIDTIDHVKLPRFHSGGVVGDEGAIGGPLAGEERLAVLQKGEGILPVNAMNNLSVQQFEMLRKNGMLGGDYGKPRIGGFGLGGIVDVGKSVVGAAGDAAGWVGGKLKEGALRAVWEPLKRVAKTIIDKAIPHQWFKDIANSIVDAIDKFVKGGEQEISENAAPDIPRNAGWRRMWQVLEQRWGGPHSALWKSSDYRPGDPGWHGKGKALDFGYGASPGAGTLQVAKWVAENYPNSLELIHTPMGFGIKNGSVVAPYARADHYDHIHWAMANGGLIKGGMGGVLAHIGEGSHDELVTPLPSNFDLTDMGKKEYHFHGDLSFPNITSGDDARDLIDNLKALAN